MKRKIAILGFGNPVRSDDGVGVYVINQLKKQLGNHGDVSLFDMGTSAFEVLFKLKGHQKIILVDAVVNSEHAAGTLFKLPAETVARTPEDDPMVFLHGLKWDQALSYARKILGSEYPEDIQVYLIAIEDTKLDMGIDPVVQAAGDQVTKLICDELETISRYERG